MVQGWLRKWWCDLGLYLLVVERGPIAGLHLHILLAVPVGLDGKAIRKKLTAVFREKANACELCLPLKQGRIQSGAIRTRKTSVEGWVAYVSKISPEDKDMLPKPYNSLANPENKDAGQIDGMKRIGIARKLDRAAQNLYYSITNIQ